MMGMAPLFLVNSRAKSERGQACFALLPRTRCYMSLFTGLSSTSLSRAQHIAHAQ